MCDTSITDRLNMLFSQRIKHRKYHVFDHVPVSQTNRLNSKNAAMVGTVGARRFICLILTGFCIIGGGEFERDWELTCISKEREMDKNRQFTN